MPEKIPETWQRVDKLREGAVKNEDPIYDLAKIEDTHRSKLKKMGGSKQDINEIANDHSDQALAKIEAEKREKIANAESMQDSLTGLHNRKYYDRELSARFEGEIRSKGNCSILMIDIDFFKKINDTYGHSFGDTALKETADCIRHSVRSSDVVIRYGGEEFLVFLPDTGSAEAADLAERIRTEVGEHGMKATGKDGSETIFKATVSIGIAGTDQLKEWRKTTQEKIHGQEDVGTHFKDTVTKCADTALYGAKKGGRNNVTVWEGDMKKEQ